MSSTSANHHVHWDEDGFRHYQCLIEDTVVAVPQENTDAVAFCPSCGTTLEHGSLLERVVDFLPGVGLTAVLYGSALAMVAASRVVPVQYGTQPLDTGDVTLFGLGLLFVVSVLLAKWVEFLGGRLNRGGL